MCCLVLGSWILGFLFDGVFFLFPFIYVCASRIYIFYTCSSTQCSMGETALSVFVGLTINALQWTNKNESLTHFCKLLIGQEKLWYEEQNQKSTVPYQYQIYANMYSEKRNQNSFDRTGDRPSKLYPFLLFHIYQFIAMQNQNILLSTHLRLNEPWDGDQSESHDK